MSLESMQNKILQEIPILRAMGIQIQKIEKNLAVVTVPLQANHNHKGTAFGGSLYASCTAACYALIYSRQIESKLEDRDLVITDGRMRYCRPIKRDFVARAVLDENSWQSLLQSLKNKRPEKLKMKCVIHTDPTLTEIACDFEAEFALLPGAR